MLEQIRSSPLVSFRRLVFALTVAFVVLLLDMVFIHLLGITTISGLLTQTLINGLGLYLALTIISLFGTEVQL